MSGSTNPKPYLTKRLTVAKADKAIQDASKRAMETLGYIVVARDGWLIKENRDGSVEQIEQLDVVSDSDLTLD